MPTGNTGFMTFEQWVEMFRAENKDGSQQRIADHLGVSRSLVCQILGTKKEPGLKARQKIFAMTGGLVTLESWEYRDTPSKKG